MMFRSYCIPVCCGNTPFTRPEMGWFRAHFGGPCWYGACRTLVAKYLAQNGSLPAKLWTKSKTLCDRVGSVLSLMHSSNLKKVVQGSKCTSINLLLLENTFPPPPPQKQNTLCKPSWINVSNPINFFLWVSFFFNLQSIHDGLWVLHNTLFRCNLNFSKSGAAGWHLTYSYTWNPRDRLICSQHCTKTSQGRSYDRYELPHT